MRLLLDTHIWLWASLEPKRLPAWIANTLAAAGNELWLSPLSAWELAQLCRKDRLQLDLPWTEWLAASVRTSGLRDAPLSLRWWRPPIKCACRIETRWTGCWPPRRAITSSRW